MLPLDVTAFIVFLLLILFHVIIRRKRIEFNSGIILEYWSGGLEWIKNFSEKHGNFLIKIGDASVIIGFILTFIGFAFILYALIIRIPTLAIALPSFGGYKYPGPIISVPFWYWLIVIFIVAFPHETFHAIFSTVEKVRIKRYGIVYFLLVPIAAFVDPDAKKLKKISLKGKLRIFSAGSFANILTSLVVILLIIATSYVTISNGVDFISTTPNTSAYYANLTGTIKMINGVKINSIPDLISFLKKVKPNQTVNILTSKGNFILKLGEEKNKTIIGIYGLSNHYVLKNGKEMPWYARQFVIYWYTLLWWLFVFTLGVGIVNMLPAKPLDGGLVFEEILKKHFGKKKGKELSIYLTIVTWTLFFAALVLPWLIKFI